MYRALYRAGLLVSMTTCCYLMKSWSVTTTRRVRQVLADLERQHWIALIDARDELAVMYGVVDALSGARERLIVLGSRSRDEAGRFDAEHYSADAVIQAHLAYERGGLPEQDEEP